MKVKVIAKLRELKTGQKIVTVPKNDRTKDWKNEDLIKLNKVDIK